MNLETRISWKLQIQRRALCLIHVNALVGFGCSLLLCLHPGVCAAASSAEQAPLPAAWFILSSLSSCHPPALQGKLQDWGSQGQFLWTPFLLDFCRASSPTSPTLESQKIPLCSTTTTPPQNSEWTWSLWMAGVGWKYKFFKVPAKPNHSRILRFCELNHSLKDGQPGQQRLSSLLR